MSYDHQTVSIHRLKLKNNLRLRRRGRLSYTSMAEARSSSTCTSPGTEHPRLSLSRLPSSTDKPHPTSSQVCYAGLEWSHEHADQFAMDTRAASPRQAKTWPLCVGVKGKRSRPVAAPANAGSYLSDVGRSDDAPAFVEHG
ncbi:hypothetical protein ANOM_007520 [Aspergillus nomiae NRRL 13137]|uniref:Uncharacterized protein n=1 Tax=Aspergillus nomiae NRRL (strain ATCC 15546 / NRRL 13137 / CBS 260.88 / M93) TaxID=1509407 RepID=A0A0L1IW52_ASPN3|nr:uncharacterized protein ANOM_007520 [Aspergillus nomiae NRRL 13137]KNG83724.1 hypothetical protein ANOM_007520 [Aspergillus nomiae NRRL 13137]